MKTKSKLNPLAVAVGTAFAVSLASSPIVGAADNPFSMNELSKGFMVAENDDASRCGSICGGEKPTLNEDGEMVKCGNNCGEVQKCGSICGGTESANKSASPSSGEDGEVSQCGSICAAAK